MPVLPHRAAAFVLFCLANALPLLIPAGSVLAETAVAPEKNPPGDIPDTQAFVTYTADTYAMQVPEGWARSGTGATVSFVSKLDGVSVTLSALPANPTLDWARQTYVPGLVAKGRAVEVVSLTVEKLPGGQAIKIAYRVNSEPNPVTTKQIRLEANRYLFAKAGKLAALDLYAPLGADNVDQWNLMSRSFAWR